MKVVAARSVLQPYLDTRPVVGEHVIRLTFINTVTSWEKARFSLSFFDGTKIPPPLKFASPPRFGDTTNI